MTDNLVRTEPRAAVTFATAIQPRDYNQALDFCTRLSKSSIVSKSLRDDPMAIMVAIQFGERHGFDILGSVQNICVINGKPSLYGDGLLAVCKGSSQWEWMKEEFSGSMVAKDAVARCTVKRKGEEAVECEFSYKKAQQANLLSKVGPWREYPERMLQMRARGFALRDCFADILSGLISAEEAEDYPVRDQHGRSAQRPQGPVLEAVVDLATGEVRTKDDILRLIGGSLTEEHLLHLGMSLKRDIGLLSPECQAELKEFYKAKLQEHRQKNTGSRTEQMLAERKQESPSAASSGSTPATTAGQGAQHEALEGDEHERD